MKIVKNSCFGGFGLSPLAVKRLAELQGKECYFFLVDLKTDEWKEISEEEAASSLLWNAFSVKKPESFLPEEKRDADGSCKTYNEAFEKIELTASPEDRTNPLLVQVVEELGVKASGISAKLKVVEIPDDIEWEIDDYDGMETIREKHRSW